MRVSGSGLIFVFGFPGVESVVSFFSSRSNVPRPRQTTAESRNSWKVSLSGLLLGFPRTTVALRRLWTSRRISWRRRRFLSPFSRPLPRFSPGLQGVFSCRVRWCVSGMWGSDVAQERQVPARFSCTGSQVPGKVRQISFVSRDSSTLPPA